MSDIIININIPNANAPAFAKSSVEDLKSKVARIISTTTPVPLVVTTSTQGG